jgi:RND family efflux transporter MFP subunit
MISAGFERAVVVLVGLSMALFGCEAEAPAKSGSDGPPPARVRVAEVREGSIAAQWSFLGDVEALQYAELAAGASGEVRRVTVRVGDRVERGALLVEVDPSLAAARVRAASASKEAAAAQLERARRDAERLSTAGPDIAAAAEIEQATQESKRAAAERQRVKAAEAEARAQLGRHRVRAPFTGVVASRNVDPGDWVDPGVTVIELVDDRGVEVLASVPLEVSRFLSAGDKAALLLGAQATTATIAGIVPALDSESRTIRVRLVPDETTGGWLLPGAAVEVVITVEREEPGALVVPRDAVVYGIADTQVVKVVDGKAALVSVEVLASSRDEVLVESDAIEAGEQLVTRGNERVFPGQPLIVLED